MPRDREKDSLGGLQLSSIDLGLEVCDRRENDSVLISSLDLWVCQFLLQTSLSPRWVNLDDCLYA
jgi:hypothetical protein